MVGSLSPPGMESLSKMNIVSFSQAVDLKEHSSIKCALIYKNQLFIGLQDGHVNVYEIKDDNLELRHHLKMGDGAIDQLEVLPDMEYLILLSGGFIHIYTLSEYKLEQKLVNYRNSNLFKVFSSTEEFSGLNKQGSYFDDSYLEKNSLMDYSDSMSLITLSSVNQLHNIHHGHRTGASTDENLFDTSMATSTLHMPQDKVPDYRSYIAICCRRKLIVYCFIKDDFNSKLEYSLNDKVKDMEFLSGEKLLVALNNNDLNVIDLYDSDPVSAVTLVNSLPYLSSSVVSSSSTFSYFRTHNSKISIVRTLPNINIISKENVLLKVNDQGDFLNYKKKSTKKNPLYWAKPPDNVLYWFPYLVLQYDNGLVEFRKVRTGDVQQVVSVGTSNGSSNAPNNIRKIKFNDNQLFIITEKGVEVWNRNSFKELLSQARKSERFEDAISLIEMLQPSVCETEFDDFFGKYVHEEDSHDHPVGLDPNQHLITEQDKKFLLLREFQIKYAKTLFEKGDTNRAVDLFISFMAPPDTVIPLFPNLEEEIMEIDHEDDVKSISEEVSTIQSPRKKRDSSSMSPKKASNHTRGHQHSHKMRSIVSLIPYLTDTRRKLNKMLNPESPKFEWKGVTISKNLYLSSREGETTDDSNSLEKMIELVDTTLFRSYLISSPRLVGPLLRVNNYCDIDVVERDLQARSMFKELIDFYYTKKLHERALELLHSRGKTNEGNLLGPLPTVQYLKKLDNDYLALIFQYIEWPISVDIEYCRDVFINDTIESESLNKFKVLSFLESKFDEDRGLDIIQDYLEHLILELNNETTKFQNRLIEIYMSKLEISKLESLLKELNSFDHKKVLKMIDDSGDKRFLVGKTIILSKLKQHEQVLDVFVYQLNEYDHALSYCNRIYKEEGPEEGQKLLMLLLTKYLESKTTLSEAFKLLSSQGSRLNFVQVLDKLPADMKISDLTRFLSSSLKQSEVESTQSQFTRNLINLRKIKLKEELLKLRSESVIIDEDSTCKVCKRRFGYSVLSWLPDNTVVHYGCNKKI